MTARYHVTYADYLDFRGMKREWIQSDPQRNDLCYLEFVLYWEEFGRVHEGDLYEFTGFEAGLFAAYLTSRLESLTFKKDPGEYVWQ
jgi:hypothetical protein